MAIIDGNLVLFKLDTAGGTPVVFGGCTNATDDDSRQEIDTSNKDTGDNSEMRLGRRAGNITADGFKAPDDATLHALEEAYHAKTLLDWIFTEPSGGHKRSGQGYIKNWRLTSPDNANYGYSFTLVKTGGITLASVA